ncbi:Kinesin-like protein kip2 [Microbotryomycetes sp. JL201]|nr:Kinesin-like protein kip2 [Microbotryomycetes sp. JL201]
MHDDDDTATVNTLLRDEAIQDGLAEISSDDDQGIGREVAGEGSPLSKRLARIHGSSTAVLTAKSAKAAADGRRRVAKLSSGSSAISTEDDEAVDGKAVNVVVCLRVRPSRANDPVASIYDFRPAQSSLSFAATHPTLLKRGAMSSQRHMDEYEFRFDALHLPPAQTESLYDNKIRPIVRATMNGFNGTVFAYGQTASGKTHTMMGSETEPGIIPLAIDELFSFIHEQHTHREFSLRVSFLEIYNETIRDLLATTPRSVTAKPLEVVGEDGVVKGLEERPVSMPSEVLSILREGDLRRRVGATDWNERSSRSHSVFMVNLIDLAGSESATGQDERRKEGAYINKSLLTLSTVISKLSEARAHGASQHVPYRDSKLTRLLQPALSGKSRIAVICTISPDEQQATETLSTLKFARRAKMVVTKAERGVLMTDAMMLRQYQQQVAALQAQIDARERAQDEVELARQLDEVVAKADEFQIRSKKAEEELARKDLELALLRERLQHAQSFILDGPTLEANARRTSLGIGSPSLAGGGGCGGTSASQHNLSSLLSPSRYKGGALAGKRVVSEMSGLGLGTPRAAGRMTRVPSGEIKEWSREAELQRELNEARQQSARVVDLERQLNELEATLASAVTESTMRREELDKAARASMDARDKIRSLEKSLSEVNERARLVKTLENRIQELEMAEAKVEQELTQARADAEQKIEQAESERDSARREMDEIKCALVGSKEEQSRQMLELESKRSLVLALEGKLRQARHDIEVRDAAMHNDNRDETIASLRRQLESVTADREVMTSSLEREMVLVKQELSAVLQTRESTAQAARDEANAAKIERDVAYEASKDAGGRVIELEELVRIERERHDLAIELAQREHEAAAKALKAEFERVKAELEVKEAKSNHLQRLVDAATKRDHDQKQFASNQRAGTDALQARLETLRGRHASTNTSSRTSSGKDELVASLESKNEELNARVLELEKQLEAYFARPRTPEPRGGDEQDALTFLVEEQKRTIDQERNAASDWKQARFLGVLVPRSASQADPGILPDPQKYLVAQSAIDKVLAGKYHSEQFDSASTITARSSLSDIGNNKSRPPYPSSRTSSIASSTSSTLGLGKGLPGSPSLYTRDQPPPLPCSPHNRDKERKTRRVTTSQDIERLKEVKGVSAARELFDSPSKLLPNESSGLRSPTKGTLRGHKGSFE